MNMSCLKCNMCYYIEFDDTDDKKKPMRDETPQCTCKFEIDGHDRCPNLQNALNWKLQGQWRV